VEAAVTTALAASCRVTHSWSAFCAAAFSADIVAVAVVVVLGVVVVLVLDDVELVVGSCAAALVPSPPVRMRNP